MWQYVKFAYRETLDRDRFFKAQLPPYNNNVIPMHIYFLNYSSKSNFHLLLDVVLLIGKSDWNPFVHQFNYNFRNVFVSWETLNSTQRFHPQPFSVFLSDNLHKQNSSNTSGWPNMDKPFLSYMEDPSAHIASSVAR